MKYANTNPEFTEEYRTILQEVYRYSKTTAIVTPVLIKGRYMLKL